MSANDISVRSFRGEDKEPVRSISRQTAFLGEPFTRFVDDGEVLADALTLYFTDFEPGSCFVAVKGEKVIGYLSGAKDVRIMRRIFNHKILPQLVIKGLRKRLPLRRNSRTLLRHAFLSFLKGEFFTPDFSGEYPAVLHINIDRDFRGQRVGSMLMERYMRFLAENSIKGVHCGTRAEDAREFFMRSGFGVLHKSKRSFLRYYFKTSLPYYILGKKI